MKKTIKVTILFLLLLVVCVDMHAQSAAQLYQEGVSLLAQAKKSQKKQTAQTARNKFSASKVLNQSADHVNKCNAGINECDKIIKAPILSDKEKARIAYQNGLTFLKQANNNKEKNLNRAKTAAENAIKQFESSKSWDPSPANVKQCDEMIVECKAFWPSDTNLSLSTNRLEFDALATSADEKQVQVSISPDSVGWKFEPQDNWFTAVNYSTEPDVLKVTCRQNEATVAREAAIIVQYKEKTDTIYVVQGGREVELKIRRILVNDKDKLSVANGGGQMGVDVKPLEISKQKGVEQMLITVYSTSSEEDVDGLGHNWKVVHLPDWIERRDYKTKHVNGLQKFVSKAADLEIKEGQLPLEENELSLSVKPMSVDDPAFAQKGQGRTGVIVIESQGKKVEIPIVQTKK